MWRIAWVIFAIAGLYGTISARNNLQTDGYVDHYSYNAHCYVDEE